MGIKLLIIICLFFAVSSQAYARDDIEGFKLGAPGKEITRILDARKYRCGIRRYPGLELGAAMGGNDARQALEFGCKAGTDEEYRLRFATYLPDQPLVMVQRTFPSPLSGQEMIERVRADYELGEGKKWTNAMEWFSEPRHIRLGILHQRYELRLTSTELIQKDKEAGAARQGR